MLIPNNIKNINDNLIPDAARSDINTLQHRRRSYGNNKLAQILHVHELTKRLKNDNNNDNVQIISVCPGWVGGTGMINNTFLGYLTQKFGFEIEAGTLAIIGACFNNNLNGGEHVTNYIPFWTNIVPFELLNKLNIRDIFCDILGLILLFVELNSYGFNISKSSPESYNKELAKELYNWTKKAVYNKNKFE